MAIHGHPGGWGDREREKMEKKMREWLWFPLYF